MKTHRIVLTGGPGGGKTTAIDLLRREIGERVATVSESATMLFSQGFPRADIPATQEAAQRAIFHVQTNLEDACAALHPNKVLLCDRGTVDGVAYWPQSQGDFFESLQTSLERELQRYDAVLFFETAAAGNFSISSGNPTRIESRAQAIALDKTLRDIWSQHPNFVFIGHQESFMAKLMNSHHALMQQIEKLS